MFCASCGKEVASGTRFCPSCGAGIPEANLTNAPAPSAAPERSVAAPNEGVPVKKPLSAWNGVLIGVGLLLLFLVLAALLGEAVKPLIGLVILGTSVWASIDSYQIRRRYTAKNTTAQPLGLFLFLLFLWIIFFPIYLVQRSRVLARFGHREGFQPPSGQQPASEEATGGTGQAIGRRSKVSKWVAPALAVLVIVDGALNPNVSATMKKHMAAEASWADVVKSLFDFSSAAAGQAPVWQTTEAQLAAAAAAAGPTPGIPVSVSGTYNMKGSTRNVGDNGQAQDQSRTGSLEIVEQPGGKIAFNLNAALVVDEASGNVHSGELDGEAEVHNGEAAYVHENENESPGKCGITMKFASDKIELKQEQSCGFGTGVDASGTYVKISSDVPKLAKQ
jgi:hypothetical protein